MAQPAGGRAVPPARCGPRRRGGAPLVGGAQVATCPAEGSSGAQEGDWRYWRREERLLRAGLLDGLPAGFAVPRSYRIAERPDGPGLAVDGGPGDAPGGRWLPVRPAQTARHLGRFNGVYLEGRGPRPLPDAPWLGRDWLRQWLARVGRFDRGAGPLFADGAAWAPRWCAASSPRQCGSG